MKLSVDNLIDDLKNRKENLPPGYLDDLNRYINIFVKRTPRYITKQFGDHPWGTKHKPLSDIPIVASLEGKYVTGCLGHLFPKFADLDVDNLPVEFFNDLRKERGLDESNSILFPGERPYHSHTHLKPNFLGNPIPIDLMHSSFKAYGKKHHIELFPQEGNGIRLPLSSHFKPLDPAYRHLDNWREYLSAFDNLDEVDFSLFPGAQLPLELDCEYTPIPTITRQEIDELYRCGLPGPGTRYHSQYLLLNQLRRDNIPQHEAELITFTWVKEYNNNYSKTIKPHPETVRTEIHRQAKSVYNHGFLSNYLPDDIHNNHNGWLTESDILRILNITQGNMPQAIFLFHLLKYIYPRRLRDYISVRHDKLIEWSSINHYLKRIDELESKGFLKRGSSYRINTFSKSIKFLDWPYGTETDAILYDGRAIETIYDTFRLLYKPINLKEILISSGCKRRTTIEIVKRTFSGGAKKGETL